MGFVLKDFTPPPPMVKTVGQKSKFVLTADVPDVDMMDIDVMLRKEDYGVPGTTEFRKNIIYQDIQAGIYCARIY